MNNNRGITLNTNKYIVVAFTDGRIIPAVWLLSTRSAVKAIL